MKIVDVDVLVKELQKAAAHKGLGAAIAGIILEYIETLLAIDAVPVVHGRWVVKYESKTFTWCSECDFRRGVYDQYGWNYCPNCGAKMDGEADG